MGRGRVAPTIKNGDWTSVRQAINRLSALILGSEAEPTFAGLTLTGDLDMSDNAVVNVGRTDYDLDAVPATEPEGRTWWNNTDHTLNISSGLGPVLQTGQELWITVRNETGAQIDDGEVVRVVGASNGRSLITLAKADNFVTVTDIVGVATMGIPNNTDGIITRFGDINGLDTSGFSAGDELFLSPATAGALTATRPVFPNYVVKIGDCEVSDASTGRINVNVVGRYQEILENAWNGAFLETFNFTIAATGGVITGSIVNDDGVSDLTMQFSTGFATLDVTPAMTVVITAGTDDVPQFGFLYIPVSTKILTYSTSDWPVEEHIKVATILVRTAATTETDGALRNQNWNDHAAGSDTLVGHINHINERMRQNSAKWFSGAEGSSTINTATTPDEVFLAATEGKIYQMHRQTFPALDLQTGDDAHVVNDSISPYKVVTDLGSETLDANGDSLANASFSFVVWGVINRTGEASHIMVNLPTGKYAKNSPEDAVSDPSNYSVYNMPSDFNGVGFLIARFTYVLQAGGNDWSLYDTQDLRGFAPNNTAGGGAGGGGVSTFLGLTDTPSAYLSQALKLAQVNAGETALELTNTPTIGADNISDGGGKAIITTTQETNFEVAFTHVSSDGSSHSDVVANTAKNTNVPTALSTGTVTATTYGITSDSGVDDVVLPEANTTQAGLLGADKWDEIVANTLKTSYTDAAAVGLNTTHRSSNGTDHANVVTNDAKVTNATHTGEVTGSTGLLVASNIIDEDNLKLETGPTNGYILTADSTKNGGMRWSPNSGGGASSLSISLYESQPARAGVTSLGGALTSLVTGQPLNTTPTNIVVSGGTGKLLVVVNAGSDVTGEIRIAGGTVDRDTGITTVSPTRLLLNLNGADEATATIDESAGNHVVSFFANAQLDTAIKKFGTAALKLDGTDDYCSMPSSIDWDMAANVTDAWTVDGFFYATDVTPTHMKAIVVQGEDVSNQWRLVVNPDSSLKFVVKSGATDVVSMTTTTGLITDATWHHFAIVKIGDTSTNVWGLYIDGTLRAKTTDSDVDSFVGLLYIGRTGFSDTNNHWAGSLDSLRVTKSNLFGAALGTVGVDTITVPTVEPSVQGGGMDTLTIDALTTDDSDVDANGNPRHAFTGAYITSELFTGSITLSTTDLTLTDVDVYHIAFEQFNDVPSVTIEAFETFLLTTNVLAEFDAYLNSIIVTGDKCDITMEADLHVGAEGIPAVADRRWTLRRGLLGVALDGSTDGAWAEIYYANTPTYIEDVYAKVWATEA